MKTKKPALSVAKILIIDDRKNNLNSIKKLLSRLNAQIITASTKKEILTLINEKHRFTLALLNAQTSKINGFNIASLLRKNITTQNIPIIFITTPSKKNIRVFKGYEKAAVDYLFRPINPHLLRSKVQIFIDIYYQKSKQQETILKELKKTKRKLEKSNVELKHLAHHDALTQLPNRLQFDAEIKRTIARAKRHEHIFALLFLDLDNFKYINDKFGHDTGDLLLKQVARRLRANLREDDFIARIGGDEFAILINEIKHYYDAGVVANKINEIFKPAYIINNNEIHVTSSIGISCYPLAGKNSKILIKNADLAMYQVKKTGCNNYKYFTKKLHKQHTQRFAIENALIDALEKNEFSLFYQPIFNLNTKKIIGMEALIRWNHPKFGAMSPEKFIPIAEESELINSIGEWVFYQACQQYSKWYNEGHKDKLFTINLSAKQLQKNDLPTIFRKILSKEKLPAKNIELELTETAIMTHADHAELLLKKFHAMGMLIAIDDFGIGYSSLNRLKKMPINALKIDKSFMKDILNDQNNSTIVKSIISLAETLNINVIAEGIETEEQLQFLLKNKCEQGQGFYFCEPIPGNEISLMLNKDKVKQ